MKNYLVLYHAPAEAMAITDKASPEERRDGMKPWFAWKERLGDKLVDLGTPLTAGLQLKPDGTSQDSVKDVTGYSVIKASDTREAKALMNGHPHLQWLGGCDIEIREMMPLG